MLQMLNSGAIRIKQREATQAVSKNLNPVFSLDKVSRIKTLLWRVCVCVCPCTVDSVYLCIDKKKLPGDSGKQKAAVLGCFQWGVSHTL